MNVKTGAILAMASKPDFDPNAPLDFSENLAYLNEQVNAEPEIYTIYKKDANGNYLRDEQGKKIPEENPDYTGTYRDIQWKNKTIHRAVLPRKRLQGHHGRHGRGLGQGHLLHHLQLLRCLRRGKRDVSLRR